MHDKVEAAESAVRSIQRQFGRGSILLLGDDGAVEPIAAISTGSLGLDAATGVGGCPRGRVIELFGPKGSGKTTLGLHAVASAQTAGGIAAFIDAGHSLDIRYAAGIGVSVDRLYLSQPDTGEQAFEIVEILCRSGGVDLVVVDSVNALTPRAEIEGEAGDEYTGLRARLMSQALRKLTAAVHRTGTCLVFLTETMSVAPVGCSNALKFYASVRIEARRLREEQDGDRVVGGLVRVRVVKNKVARPFGEAEFTIRPGIGIDRVAELADRAVALGALAGSADVPFAATRDAGKLAAVLRESGDLQASLERTVRERLGLTRLPSSST